MSEGRALALAAVVAVVVSAVTTKVILARQSAPAAPIVVEPKAEPSPKVEPAPKPKPAAKSAPAPVAATAGADIHGALADAHGATKLYVFQVPEDAVQIDVTLSSEDDDMELSAVSGAEVPERGDDWTWSATPEEGRAKLSLTRHAENDLKPGPLLVEVHPSHATGGHGKKGKLAFTLRADVVRLPAPKAIAAGKIVDGSTSPEAGHRADFVLDVPPGATVLRIDIVDAARDVDLFASSKGPALDEDSSEWSVGSTLARESLVIDEESDPKLPAGGRIWFAVIDPSLYDAPVKFRVAVTAGDEPPAEALAIPELPIPTDPRDRAVAAVVEVIVDDGWGSGTIVTADGLVLTARHVIGDRTGEDDDISVAMDLDPKSPTRDLFHAKVVKADAGLDVAILRITSGLYGQPLPRGYRFPACPVATGALPRLGDPLVTIGFPEPAGTGTRAPVMYSKGVVSGFEREKSGLRIKTDAFVASGSSGGAALDGEFRLVGVPVFTITETEGTAQMGFLVPVAELPADWRALWSK